MAPYCNILAWKISWAEKPGGLQSTGPQRAGRVYATERTHAYTGRDTMDNIIIAKKEKQQTVNQDFDTQQKQLSNMKANPSLLLLRM